MTSEEILISLGTLLDAKLEPIKADLSSLKEDVSGLKDDVSTLKTDVSGLKEDMSSVKADVSGLRDDVSTLKTDVSTLNEKVSVLEKETSVNSVAILKIEQKIDIIFDIQTVTNETNQIVKDIKSRVDRLETQVFSHELAIKRHFKN